MTTNSNQYAARTGYEQASERASELAERIGRSAREGISRTEIAALLEAWHAAREAARSAHERLLVQRRWTPTTRPTMRAT